MNNSTSFEQTAAAQPGRWLVVDDEADLSDLLATLLSEINRAGVESFTSSPEALSAFSTRSQDFDLVVTDRDMPGIDGLEFARRLHREAPHVKLILVSAHTDDLSTEILVSAGIDAVLEKPFALAGLERIIREMALHPAFTKSRRRPPTLAQAA